MRLLRSIKVQMQKFMFQGFFAACALIIALLCFTASAYSDYASRRDYSVAEVMFSFSSAQIKSNEQLMNIWVFEKGLSGYTGMFLPIIAALPFVCSFCTDRRTQRMRFEIFRTGSGRYYLSQLFAGICSGGLVTALGYMMFGVVVLLFFPNARFFGHDTSFYISLGLTVPLWAANMPLWVLQRLVAAFLYGAVSVLPAVLFCSFMSNEYMITCIPFMMMYMWSSFINKAFANQWFSMRVLEIINPASLTNIFSSANRNWMLPLYLGCIIVTGAAFCVIMNRRIDYGA